MARRERESVSLVTRLLCRPVVAAAGAVRRCRRASRGVQHPAEQTSHPQSHWVPATRTPNRICSVAPDAPQRVWRPGEYNQMRGERRANRT